MSGKIATHRGVNGKFSGPLVAVHTPMPHLRSDNVLIWGKN
jgi:hypothetical protein